MRTDIVEKDTPAWIFQVWASFVIALGTTVVGIAYLPLDIWLRSFLWMGVTFSIGSSFTLAKTLRDAHEAKKREARLSDAKTELMMRELEGSKLPTRTEG